MSTISAQISIHPLRRHSVAKAIEDALNALRTYDVEVNTGSMSTEIVGEEIDVFSAVRASFLASCATGDAVLVMTVSNACPLDGPADQTAQEG
jgi:uncharacterized protein YqgV (UPF0045/DUF77 family)